MGILGASEHADSRRVRVVGDGPSARTVIEGIRGAEVERVDTVATLTPAKVSAVVVVVPGVEVAASTAVERVRRVHGRTPVVVATDEVAATRADAIVPIDTDAVERTVEEVLESEQVEQTRRRVARVVQLAADMEDSVDADEVCERLAAGVGYDTAWLVRREESTVVPVAAAGIPLSALRTVPTDASDPWARALESGESVVEPGELCTVAVPFDDRCLVCTTDTAVGDAEVSAIEHVVRSAPATSGSLQPRYALLGKAIAHEVNNQLDVAMVHLDLVDGGADRGDGEHREDRDDRDDREDRDDRDGHLAHVEAALTRIDAVIDEVNALVAPELDVAAVSLRDVAVDVWEGVSTADASLEGRDGTVEADDRLLRLLLSNLFRNAIQHGGSGVTVEVGPLEDGGFYVADDGGGFDETVGEELFEWGWSDEGGTGIGLALVSLVADRHGWSVDHAGSDGACFEFRP